VITNYFKTVMYGYATRTGSADLFPFSDSNNAEAVAAYEKAKERAGTKGKVVIWEGSIWPTYNAIPRVGETRDSVSLQPRPRPLLMQLVPMPVEAPKPDAN
jgi:hypothetical protein